PISPRQHVHGGRGGSGPARARQGAARGLGWYHPRTGRGSLARRCRPHLRGRADALGSSRRHRARFRARSRMGLRSGLERPGRVAPDLKRAADLIEERGCALGTPLFISSATTSTNDEALRAAKQGAAHGSTWVTEEQTAGRGRRGRTWFSPPGEGLLFSVLARLPGAPATLPPVALLAGLAVHEAVARAVPGVDVRLKWPNDVVAGKRKLAGVLVEAVTVGS